MAEPKPTRGGRPPRGVKAEARALLSKALAEALRDVGASQGAAGRWMGVAERTVGSWVRGETAISVEALLASPKLGKAFLARLCGKQPLAHADAVTL
jgi:hypothetical protein